MAQQRKSTNSRSSTTRKSSSSTRKRKSTRSKKQPDYVKQFITWFVATVKSEKTHRIFGLFCWLIAAFLLIAFTSYIFTGDIDHSGVQKGFPADDGATQNWLGRIGSYLSHLFIFRWFGLASYILPIILFFTGTKILFKEKARFRLFEVYQYAFLGLIVCATIFGFFGDGLDFPLGGGVGGYISGRLISLLGRIGTALLLFFGLGALLLMIADVPFSELLDGWRSNFSSEEDNRRRTSRKLRGSSVEALKRENLHAKTKEYDEEIVAKIGGDELEIIKPKGLASKKPATPLALPESADPTLEVEGKQIRLDFEQRKAAALAKARKAKAKSQDPEDLELAINKDTSNNIPTSIQVENKEEGLAVGEEEYDPTLDLSAYEYPTLDLLKRYGRDLYEDETLEVNREELERNKDQIVETLSNYNIAITRISATPGPTVTLYEIIPAPGVRISKIRNLEDDIALSLAALGIRIIAPMPGKGTIGIEVPNQKKEIVSLRSILVSKQFKNAKMDLPVGLGKTISDDNFVADLAKMPHMLMAGATGQGKSVCLNSILISLLYSKHPAELKFVMIDPKKVELSLFNMIEKHFLAKLPGEEEAIVTDTKKAIFTLNALCIEMDARYDLLKRAYVRNIREYNAKFKQRKLNPLKGHRYLPYIVLVVDEFADLIMTAGKDVEMPIARLAQLARAIGIHLVIATQRPTVNIITGTIKANFPVRVAFRVTSKVDSRTILDQGGANQLIGKGDLLLSIGSELVRLQGAFVDTPEVANVAEFIGRQKGYPEAFLLPEYRDESEDKKSGASGGVELDDLFEEAARLVVSHQSGSTSLIQRRMKLGYNRAGRIMDQLEAVGIVGPNVGSKAREVYVTDLLSLEEMIMQIRNN